MLPEEVTKFIGKAVGVNVFEVEKGAIKRFAVAVNDPNPLYYDEEYAKNSRYGSIIAPPGFISSPWFAGRVTIQEKEGAPSSDVRGELIANLVKASYSRLLDGGMDYEFFSPVRAGDTLTASSTIKDIVEREGKAGKMAFLITETTYTNQNGDLVAKTRGTSIHPQG